MSDEEKKESGMRMTIGREALRDYFAAHITSGVIAHSGLPGNQYERDYLAAEVYRQTDALLKAREEVK